MAGKLLPIALAALAGISIGVASFDSEFKEQRRKKLEEEHERALAAAAQKNTTSETPAAKPQETLPLPLTKDDQKSSGLSSMLGLWAWKKVFNSEPQVTKESPQANSTAAEPKR